MKPPLSLTPVIARWRAAFRAHPGHRLALYVEQREEFSSALLAAWAERKQVFLPGDNLPHTVKALKSEVDFFVGDFASVKVVRTSDTAASEDVVLDTSFPGVVVFTSGSSGAPVAIVKRLEQLSDEVATLESTFGARLHPQAHVVSTVSHQHIYGLLCAVLWPLFSGRHLTPRRLEYPEELEPVLAGGPTVLISSPAHLKRLPEGRLWNTASMGAVFSSGGPLTDDGAARAKAVLGQWPVELYGSSETGGIAWRQRPTLSWKPLFGVQVRISPQGVLEVQSPHLPDSSWLTTADIAVLQGEELMLLGRADRIAKIEEKRVSLDFIERLVVATELLTEARVVLLDGARVTVGLVGVVSPRGAQLERKALIAALKETLENAVERVAWPRRFRFVDALPMNEQGKVTQGSLRALFQPLRPEVQWLVREAERATLEMSITPDLRVFDGHFPEAPVVPGVAQVDWAIAWGKEAFGNLGRFVRLDALKFQALLRPGHTAQLSLEWNAEKRVLTFKYASASDVFSSGRVVWTA